MAPSHDPSVFDEPHMRGDLFEADASEAKADETLEREVLSSDPAMEQLEHGIWDEPSTARELAGAMPRDEITYAAWLHDKAKHTGWGLSWGVTLLVALAAGPWAIMGALLTNNASGMGLLLIVVLAPLAEEMMKVAAPLYVVEKRPYLFRHPIQILLCCAAGGIAFAALENLLYMTRGLGSQIIHWRWFVCTAMHTLCSFFAGWGLLRMWEDAWKRRAKPQIAVASPFLLTSVFIHGTYNALSVLLEFFGILKG